MPGGGRGVGPAAEALISWLRRFAVVHDNKHPIAAELLRHTDAADAVFGSSRDRVLAAEAPLLLAAQQAHEVRDSLTLVQVLDLTLAATTIPGDRAYVEPIVQTTLGRTQGPGDPLPTPLHGTAGWG